LLNFRFKTRLGTFFAIKFAVERLIRSIGIKILVAMILMMLSAPVWAAPSCSSLLETVASSLTSKKVKDVLSFYDGKKKIGFIKFGFVDEIKTLFIEDIEIHPKYRERKLSRFFLKKAVHEFPDADLIDSILLGTNYKVYIAEKNKIEKSIGENAAMSDSSLAAVMKTPAYRIRASLGFSIIKEFKVMDDFLILVVGRDESPSSF